jgi:hypothetical protein
MSGPFSFGIMASILQETKSKSTNALAPHGHAMTLPDLVEVFDGLISWLLRGGGGADRVAPDKFATMPVPFGLASEGGKGCGAGMLISADTLCSVCSDVNELVVAPLG